MASPPTLPVEDQTDEDFFDRLVDDDFGVTGLREGSIEMDRSLFGTGIANERLQLEDSDDTRVSFVEEDGIENKINQASQTPKEGAELMDSVASNLLLGAAETMVSEEKGADAGSSLLSFEAESLSPSEMKSEIKSCDTSVERSGGSKSAGVKKVPWSAFCADSQQYSFSGVEPFSDFLIESSDVSTNQMNMNGDLKSTLMDRAVPGQEMGLVSSEEQDSYIYGTENGYSTDANDPKYWENLYPGWKFDAGTGQWYQVDGNDAVTAQSDNYDASNVNVQESFRDDHLTDSNGFISGKTAEVSYSQQSSSLMVGGVAEDCNTSVVSSWNHYSQDSNGYPPNMVFDPQYPGWYFDTNTQQWSTLDVHTQNIWQASQAVQGQAIGDMNTSNDFIGEGSSSFYGDVGPLEQNDLQGESNQNVAHASNVLTNKYAQHSNHQFNANDNSKMSFSGNQQAVNLYDPKLQEMNYPSQKMGFNSWDTVQSSVYSNSKVSAGFQNFGSAERMHQFNQPKAEQSLQFPLSQSIYPDEKSVNYHEQNFHSSSYPHPSYTGNEGRSSAGRPPHALVTFGFGGKLVVMKDPNTFGMTMGYNNKETAEATVSILNLMEVVKDKAETVGDYFYSLCQHSCPGPLVGGNASTKDVYKWIDESIMHCESHVVDPKKGKMVKLLLSLLKISCQHYGKLRSPFGSGASLEQENDGPESSVTKLFASARADGPHLTRFMKSIPSEAHLQATSIEMQKLLVSGKRKDALQCAQVGQLWGPALVLAAQLGEKFYVDTVKQMAQRLLICGSPLRTLCLLIAGQPADVFSSESSTNGSFYGITNGDEQPSEIQSNCMLDDWEENLAIITANRTKDDELVVIHLGDCLWKEKGEVTAAHTCYLTAEANFEPYSDSARLCLIGADHWKYPRTYACPDAIQRTELYEYAKVLGNSQFVLLPFQPYKFIYANMLSEIGRTSDSLRYCQASMKLLRNSSRTPEVEMWKSLFSSLEERLSAHQQGGYGENLAAAKLVGKLFTSIDRSIHRMMGAPSLPPMPQNHANGKESHLVSPKVVNSQSTMAMSTLIPSASVDGMSEWTSDSGRKSLHSRSISEPDFGRTPKQDASNNFCPGNAQNKASPSRFGRIGSQLFQKTVGWVSRSRQAKLGESNKFHYDEKLKRWVEEGVEPPEEVTLPPPPKITSFQNGITEYNINNALKNQSLDANGASETKSAMPPENSGIPSMAPIPNQFSGRRMGGVRSRYVDTFNKGGGDSLSSNSFQSPSTPAVKPASGAKFFVPTAPSAPGGGILETGTSLSTEISFNSPPPPLPPPSMIERLPSMNSIDPYKNNEISAALQNGNGFLSPPPPITSWNGNNAKLNETTPCFPSNPGTSHSSSLLQQFNGGSPGDDLDEVELS